VSADHSRMCGGKVDARNKLIEDALNKDKERLKNEFKLLILGAGECGKSTVAKVRLLAADQCTDLRLMADDDDGASATCAARGARMSAARVSDACAVAAVSLVVRVASMTSSLVVVVVESSSPCARRRVRMERRTSLTTFSALRCIVASPSPRRPSLTRVAPSKWSLFTKRIIRSASVKFRSSPLPCIKM